MERALESGWMDEWMSESSIYIFLEKVVFEMEFEE